MVENKLSMLFLIVICYLAGRLHQWYRSTELQADEFRRGYDAASRSMFGLASRLVGAAGQPARGIARVTGAVSSTKSSPHSAEGRHDATTRINQGEGQ